MINDEQAQLLEVLASKRETGRLVSVRERPQLWREITALRAGAAALRAHQTPALRTALDELWIWATEQRTHVDTDPVPNGLEARVVAALQQSDPPPPQTPAWQPEARELQNLVAQAHHRFCERVDQDLEHAAGQLAKQAFRYATAELKERAEEPRS